jgi:hypothetical protein
VTAEPERYCHLPWLTITTVPVSALVLRGPELLPLYRARLRELGEPSSALVDLPRLVTIWHGDPNSTQRDDWSPRQVETWIRVQNWQREDLEEFHVLTGAFIVQGDGSEADSGLGPGGSANAWGIRSPTNGASPSTSVSSSRKPAWPSTGPTG